MTTEENKLNKKKQKIMTNEQILPFTLSEIKKNLLFEASKPLDIDNYSFSLRSYSYTDPNYTFVFRLDNTEITYSFNKREFVKTQEKIEIIENLLDKLGLSSTELNILLKYIKSVYENKNVFVCEEDINKLK